MKSTKKWCSILALILGVVAAVFALVAPMVKAGTETLSGMELTFGYKNNGMEMFGFSILNLIPYALAIVGVIFAIIGIGGNKVLRCISMLCFLGAGALLFFCIEFIEAGSAVELYLLEIEQETGMKISEGFFMDMMKKEMDLHICAYVAMGIFALAAIFSFIGLFGKKAVAEEKAVSAPAPVKEESKKKDKKQGSTALCLLVLVCLIGIVGSIFLPWVKSGSYNLKGYEIMFGVGDVKDLVGIGLLAIALIYSIVALILGSIGAKKNVTPLRIIAIILLATDALFFFLPNRMVVDTNGKAIENFHKAFDTAYGAYIAAGLAVLAIVLLIVSIVNGKKAAPAKAEAKAEKAVPAAAPAKVKAEKPAKVKVEKESKKVSYRVFGAILAALCVAAFFLPIGVLKGGKGFFFVDDEHMLFEQIMDIFDKLYFGKLFGFLPIFTDPDSMVGIVAGLSFYALLLILIVSFVVAVITIFSKKKAPALLRTATFFFTWGVAAYAIGITSLTSYIVSLEITFDWFAIAIGVAGALLYFSLSCVKVGKKAVASAIQFVLTLAFTATLVYAVTVNNSAVTAMFKTEHGDLIRWIVFGILAAALLNLIVASYRVITSKGLASDLCRYVLQMLLALGILYVHYWAEIPNDKLQLFALIAAGVSLLQLIIVTAQLCRNAKKKALASVAPAATETVATEEAVPAEEVKEYVEEEYVEAVPYEGGPVAGVEMAEEVIPSCSCGAAPAEDMPPYDVFMSTLSEQERNDFTDLFILKCKGDMGGIPTYKVGEDNKDFFRKIFIYLGQCRDKIPNGLMSKIYTHAMKLS